MKIKNKEDFTLLIKHTMLLVNDYLDLKSDEARSTYVNEILDAYEEYREDCILLFLFVANFVI